MLIIEIVNDTTGDGVIDNYDFVVRVNNKVIHEGRVEEHNRLTGWTGLLNDLNKTVNGDRVK